jgi:hypothetical protein
VNPDTTPQPNTPTIILVGGTFIADTGEQLDSRQPFADDPRSRIARQALAGSELWWLVTASLVLPLLDAEGDYSFAVASGAKSVVTPRPDGTVQRRRLALVLPGGVRTSKSNGRWELTYGAGLGRNDLTAPVLVDTSSLFWQNASALQDYSEFEQSWFKHKNLIIVGVHTHADTVYLDRYVNWVADGRHKNAPGASMPYEDWGRQTRPQHAVVPIEADFRVTAVVQNGKWVDPAPLEAARSLIQARFDLKLGIWDLITNHTLRATLLKEAPVLSAPDTPAAKTAGFVERQQQLMQLRAQRTDRQKSRDASLDAIAGVVASLDASGWTTSLPGVRGDIDPAHRLRRSLPLAVAPECDQAEVRARHPALRPGQTILWLQFEIFTRGEHDTTIILVIPPALSSLNWKLFQPFFQERMPALERVAGPNHTRMGATYYSREIITYDVAVYERTRAISDIDHWAQRISDVARMTPAWVELFAPLARAVLEVITANPRLGCT